ncbi:MAG: HXXEE domain-containing protein [Flavobacteriaceae bacterium]|nr:HXXEE domain-containing protein [Flavobacteriaceae bacterium]
MNKFKNLIVLGPLIYALHHFEEMIIFNFRDWRLRYFPDNNSISTEAILCILISLLLIFVFIHLIKKNRASAHLIIYFLITAQVANAFFHIFFSFYYQDFSPGTITAVLLYLPVNYFIIRAAFNEEFLKNRLELGVLVFLGLMTFIIFEMIGPIVILISILSSVLYYIMFNRSKYA